MLTLFSSLLHLLHVSIRKQEDSLCTEVANSSKKDRIRSKPIALFRNFAIIVLNNLLNRCVSFKGFGSSWNMDTDIDDCI
jgi:hypothetical protein